MKTTPVTEHLTQLTKLHFVNAFLVRENDGFTLVDTTMGRSAKGLIEAASSAGAPIRRIALTHGHGDHVGLLDALRDSSAATSRCWCPSWTSRSSPGRSRRQVPRQLAEGPHAGRPAAQARRPRRQPGGGRGARPHARARRTSTGAIAR